MRREFVLALGLDLSGAAGALLIALRTWQVVTTPRPHPLRDDVLQLTGRTVDGAPTALALVALAGVVAVLATRGVPRRLLGAALVLAGIGIVWRSLAATGAVSPGRARALVAEKHPTVTIDAGVVPTVTTNAAWAGLSVGCGLLVLVAGLLVVSRGHRWQAMAARYERAPSRDADPEADRAKAAASLWTALDRGEDPTGGDESDPRTGDAPPLVTLDESTTAHDIDGRRPR
ncbi:MAG TPA: Trp biosynthesis-associated membrane protein [Jatrophihabitans sp.]|jgi:uncharacterized membrane protein (TIGR02234 family)|uniref:Trp biosynthesis-associated membrane protein n=1 Tax=Jatrophihabitans sp. TaxID=1932789 RepID=UPI002E048F1D|nr:Trp biosynthesis-associated membrane protein [Jatrophihabitans sp.]